MEEKQNTSERLIIAFTVFLSFFGLTLAFPVFVPLLGINGGILPPETTREMRGMILGLIIGLYPLVQFFTAPILGILSDRIGRKPVLIISAAGNLIGNAVLASGIIFLNIWVVLAGRIITGSFAGSFAVAQSSMSDISEPENRARNFGILGAMFGASLALGPALGGVLSDHTNGPFFTLATPFGLAAVLAMANMVMLMFWFKETLNEKHRQNGEFHILTGPRNFIAAFSDPSSRLIFIVVFLISFGFNFFSQFFQYFLIEKFQVTNTQFGILFGYIGIWSIITQGFITKPVAKKFNPGQVLRVTILVLALLFPLILLIPHYYLLYAVVLFIPMMNGLTMPNLTAVVSGLADAKGQGKILGVNQSVMAVSQFLSPLIGGYLVGINYTMPIWVTFVFILAAWFAFIPCYNRHCAG